MTCKMAFAVPGRGWEGLQGLKQLKSIALSGLHQILKACQGHHQLGLQEVASLSSVTLQVQASGLGPVRTPLQACYTRCK